MKIDEFTKKFTIHPATDIEPYFLKVKELDVDAHNHKACFNCGNEYNNTRLKSSPWTSVQYCWACDSLNVIYIQDRMSGVYTDTIHCYQEKPSNNKDAAE